MPESLILSITTKGADITTDEAVMRVPHVSVSGTPKFYAEADAPDEESVDSSEVLVNTAKLGLLLKIGAAQY